MFVTTAGQYTTTTATLVLLKYYIQCHVLQLLYDLPCHIMLYSFVADF